MVLLLKEFILRKKQEVANTKNEAKLPCFISGIGVLAKHFCT